MECMMHAKRRASSLLIQSHLESLENIIESLVIYKFLHHQSSSEHRKQPGLASQLPININIFSGLGIVWMVVRGT